MALMGLNKFYGVAQQRDFSRKFQLKVFSIGGILNQDDNVYITTATIPGYSITNVPTPYMGLSFNIPGTGKFEGSDAWSVTFRCDAQLNIRQKLIEWQKVIFNSFVNETGESTGNISPRAQASIAEMGLIGNDGNTEIRKFKLIGIYPVSVGAMDYDTTDDGQIVTLPVTLAYQWWQLV